MPDEQIGGLSCDKCGRPRKISTSNANKGQIAGCTYCRQREWYEKNKERVTADSKAYYQATRERRIEVADQWRQKNMQRHRDNARRFKLKNKYGITPEQYDQMFADQKGLCFLCGKPSQNGRRLSVDHCHKTSTVRKLLCQDCNLLLGRIESDPTWLDRALQYLKS